MIVYTTAEPDRDAPARPGTDARSLYLAGTADTRVALDGPALAVQQGEQAEQLFPLQRVARVYSGAAVAWDTAALLACAERGIGVVFVDADGDIAARLLGRPGARDELLHRLREFLLLPQAPARYRHWLDGMRRRLAWWACMKLDAPDQQRDPRRARLWLEQRAAAYAGASAAEHTRQWLRTLAHQRAESHLLDLGFGTATELGQAGEPNLARDLAELLNWYLQPPRLNWLRRRQAAARQRGEPLRAPRHADAVRLFESRSVRVEARLRDLSGSLHRWLIDQA
jgi:hypothetical protein